MRILLTGGRGFIGEWLYSELAFDHDVAVIDIEDGDLRDPGVAMGLISDHAPEVVVHLAAQVGRLHGEDDCRHTIGSNAAMTALVARATAEVGARLVYTSTSEVYGDQRHALCDEYQGPFDLPHNLYGLSKRWGEEVSKLYAPNGLTIVRPSMPYGPGAPPGRGRRAMDNILWQAHHRMPIPVHAGAKRSWCWIGDLVRGFRLAIEKGRDGILNLGRDDTECSMLDLARLACTLTGAPEDLIEVVRPPARQTVVKRLSTQRLRDLGWKPEVELDQGMAKVLGWIKNFDVAGDWCGDPVLAEQARRSDRRTALLAA